MKVGTRVYCKSDDLKLDNATGVVSRTKLLGCDDSMTVVLDNGERVAFFGPKINCVGTNPLSKDPTHTIPATEKPVVKKRATRKKVIQP